MFPSLFPTPTHVKVPGLNITTYMAHDTLIKMHFRWGSTDTDQFEAELKHSLNKANRVLQKGKTLYLVLDNASYHKKSVVEDAIESVNEYNKRHRFPPREIVPLFTAPSSPDLNLVEYYNRYYKATLRRALDKFLYLTIQRGDRRGRPAKAPRPSPARVPKIVTAFSPDNLISVAKFVYKRIKAAQHPLGTWGVAYNHVLKWANALVDTKGSYPEASSKVSQNMGELPDDMFPIRRVVVAADCALN